jgi:hypothetical protein
MNRLQGIIPIEILVVLAVNVVVALIGYFAVAFWTGFAD